MTYLNMDLVTTIFSTPSLSGREELVLSAIKEFAEKNGWPTRTDAYGNMYVQKGSLEDGEKFPVLVAHVDTVHHAHLALIEAGKSLDIREENGELRAYYPGTDMQTGIGGDDKAGVIVALEILSRIEKGLCAFFRDEEPGCLGSLNLHRPTMDQGGYAIQFDAPGNEASVYVDGVKLYDDTFRDLISPVLVAFGADDFVEYNPYTDIARVRERLDYNTLNMGAGYHNYHTSSEYVVVSEMERAVACAVELVQTLGNKLYLFDESDVTVEVEYGKDAWEAGDWCEDQWVDEREDQWVDKRRYF